MSITLNANAYANDVARSPDSYRYLGPNNTFGTKDYLDTYRTAPKPTPTFSGVGKAEAKLTRTLTDGTDEVGNGIISVSTSFPVDADIAEVEAMITDLGTWLLTSSADDLLIGHEINQ
jgi:hypothetical protein